MGLTKAQSTTLSKAMACGGSSQGVALDESVCTYLVALIVKDLKLSSKFPDLPGTFPNYFDNRPLSQFNIPGLDFYSLFDRLIDLLPDADTYFYCLAALHKSRLKYSRIIECQSIPTMDQVGPRSLLQFGQMPASALATFMLWRKWLFDIDNRAGQETGYLFEPIIAHAIGGLPISATRSPIRRNADGNKGRQVDCLNTKTKRAYEFKIRVTIAASGQGRWGEELEFPIDCRKSGFTPILIVLDPTANPKLDELERAFKAQKGEVFIGDAAWKHLEDAAGETMSVFLDKYVRTPIKTILDSTPIELPKIAFEMNDGEFVVEVNEKRYSYGRNPSTESDEGGSILPGDIEDESPGP